VRASGSISGFPSDGCHVVISDGIGGFSLWELTLDQECRTLHHGEIGNRTPRPEGWVNAVDFSPDGRWLVSAGALDIRFWSVNDSTEVAHLPGRGAFARFHPQRNELLIASSSGVERRRLVTSADTSFRLESPEPLVRKPTQRSGGRCCWSHDGRWMAFLPAGQESVIVQNADDPSKRFTLGPHPAVGNIALSADGRWLASGPWHGHNSIMIWEVPSGRVVWELPCVDGWPAFSPDGRWLATHTEKDYRLWHTGSWRARPWRAGDPNQGWEMAFSRDSETLAIIAGATIKLIEVASGNELATLKGPDPPPVTWVSFSPDGSLLAAAMQDHTVQIWDLKAIRRQLAAIGLDWKTQRE
jgi:WD40 repeat protein